MDRDKQIELSDALHSARSFHENLDEMLRNLGKIDGLMASAQPVGGLPETAKLQLEKFKVGFNGKSHLWMVAILRVFAIIISVFNYKQYILYD